MNFSWRRLTIKGASDEDAVLCTSEKTYTVRSIVLSNSVLVVTRDPGDAEAEPDTTADPVSVADVVIRDQLCEILELVPSVPRLHKLNGLLRGREYDEGHEDEEAMTEDDEDNSPVRIPYELGTGCADTVFNSRRKGRRSPTMTRGKRSRRAMRNSTRVSATAAYSSLKARARVHISCSSLLIVSACIDELRPIAPSHLTKILECLLINLVSQSLPYTDAPLMPLIHALEDDHEVPRDITRQVMCWFGRIDEGQLGSTWEMDADAVVREIGLGIMRAHRVSTMSCFCMRGRLADVEIRMTPSWKTSSCSSGGRR